MLNDDIFLGCSMTPFIMLMQASSKCAYCEGPFTKSMYRRLLIFWSCSIEGVTSYSARALVKKTQEPGIKLQKADFFRNDTWTSPKTNSEDAPKIPLVHFF